MDILLWIGTPYKIKRKQMILKELIELTQKIAKIEGNNLEVITTGYYGEPYEYSKSDFRVEEIYIDKGLNPIKPKKAFIIDHIDIGEEPD